jgi:hypothetical protein
VRSAAVASNCPYVLQNGEWRRPVGLRTGYRGGQ